MVQSRLLGGIAHIGAFFCLWFATTLWSSNTLCSAEYLSEPTLRWSLQLEGSGRLSSRGMRKGNAVVAHNDGKRLVATMDDGSLHVVQTTPQVKSHSVFEPTPVDNKYTECRSGPVIVYPAEGQEAAQDFPGGTPSAASIAAQGKSYVVYSVVDATVASDIQFDESGLAVPSENEGSTTSRVLAVNVDDGSLKWSVQVPGRVQGDVVVGTTGIYISHNIGSVGFLSVIMVNEDGSSADAVATLTFSNGRNGPFGPPALQQNAGSGDVVIVAESWGQGFSQDLGGLYMLTPSSTFDDANGRGNDSYELRRISSWSYSSIAPPLVDGDSVFLGAAGGNIAGWTGNQRNDLSGISSGRVEEIEPQWVYQMEENPRNQSQPVLSTPVIDSVGETVCSPGVNSDFYCLILSDGRIGWSERTESQVLVRPLVWEDSSGSVIYTIESLNGRISQFDLYTGQNYWQYSCADIGALDDLCQASVEAEFAIAPSGNIIYYGDIFGRITSLEIATFQTEAPTMSPTGQGTAEPTQEFAVGAVPSAAPSANKADDEPEWTIGEEGNNSSVFDEVGKGEDSLNDTSTQQQSEKNSSSLGIYIGAALGGLCVLIVPIVVFWLMRGGKEKSPKDDEVMVEIIDDFDMENSSNSRDYEDLEVSTDASTSDGIEIEYIASKTIAATPPRRKKKKKKKSPQTQTPQTATTLESIEEIEEETAPKSIQETDIQAENLTRKFDMAASDSSSDGSTSELSGEDRHSSPQIPPGQVGIAHGTNHLELAVGYNNNSNLSLLDAEHGGGSDSDDASEMAPPPPPPPATLASSMNQWSWGKLLNFGTPQTVKDSNASVVVKSSSPLNEKVVLKPVAKNEMNPAEKSESSRINSPDFPADEVSHRAETPPVSNHGKIRPSTPDSWASEGRDQHCASTGSWPGLDSDSLSPKSDLWLEAQTKSEKATFEPKIAAQDMNASNVEEEKKDNEESYSEPRSPVGRTSNAMSPALHVMNAARDAMSPVSRVSEQNDARILSPNEQSQISDYGNSPLSPTRSPSNLSTDDSLFTSATGATGEKVNDVSNLSPLSLTLFDRDIFRRERSDAPHDEASDALVPPNLNGSNTDKFRYLDEEEDVAPDDEVITAPGFQYMTNNAQDEQRGDKFGRSVRSKRNSSTSFKSKLDKQNSFGSTGSGSESPLAAIYNQLASMGQRQAEEKKHSFKRRSKRVREETPEPDSDLEQQEPNETWGSFLQELAEAEKQFFSPTSVKASSLLQTSESHDSEDAEVARINNTL